MQVWIAERRRDFEPGDVLGVATSTAGAMKMCETEPAWKPTLKWREIGDDHAYVAAGSVELCVTRFEMEA